MTELMQIPKGTSSVLFIPRILPHITEEDIFNTLYNLNLGIITNIDIKNIRPIKPNIKLQNKNKIPKLNTHNKHNEHTYKKAYIHISEWFNTDNAFNAYNRLSNDKEIKVIYDEFNWYWKIVMYKDPPHKTIAKT